MRKVQCLAFLPSGTAKMRILNRSLVNYHLNYLKEGVIDYMTNRHEDIA